MFTGLIEELGTISQVTAIAGGKKIAISASKVLDDLKIDHSMAVDGVCLTVVHLHSQGFAVEAVGETLVKTTIGTLAVGRQVNLERAMKLSDRLGGHLVQGHVNDMVPVTAIENRGDNWFIEVNIPENLRSYVISEGSICLNGISLTIAQLKDMRVGISVIPHTYKNTNIKNWQIGQNVNIETDFLARYVENMVKPNKGRMSEDWLKKMGY